MGGPEATPQHRMHCCNIPNEWHTKLQYGAAVSNRFHLQKVESVAHCWGGYLMSAMSGFWRGAHLPIAVKACIELVKCKCKSCGGRCSCRKAGGSAQSSVTVTA